MVIHNKTKKNIVLSMYNKQIKLRTTRTQVIKTQIKESHEERLTLLMEHNLIDI